MGGGEDLRRKGGKGAGGVVIPDTPGFGRGLCGFVFGRGVGGGRKRGEMNRYVGIFFVGDY